MYNYIDDLDKMLKLPRSGNQLHYSVFKEYNRPLTFRGFAIKYVIDGLERYKINGQNYDLKSNEFLLANPNSFGEAVIDSKKSVKGICINLESEIISEVLSGFVKPEENFPDISVIDFFNSSDFLDNKYSAANSKLGNFLMNLGEKINRNPLYDYTLDNEFYYTVIEKLMEDHIPIINELYSISTVKHSTRKDLYKKVCKGKEFLELNFNEKTTVSSAAQYANLSEYHFFRLFKASFNTTPQQYLIETRLSESKNLLKKNYSVSEVAIATGFSDIYSFSKSFKKHFGTSPCTEKNK